MFSWVFYAAAVGSWTLFNVIVLPKLSYGMWVYVGAAGSSLLMRYHFRLYLGKLRQMRTFILYMNE